MKIVTDLNESSNLLRQYTKANVQIWAFHISHKRLAIRLSYLNSLEVLYVFVVSAEYITGPFSWSGSNITIVKEIDDVTSESIYKITDKVVGFELVSSGGFSLAQGLESEFGTSFDNFLSGLESENV